MRKFHLQRRDHSRSARAVKTAAALAAAAVSFAFSKNALAVTETWTDNNGDQNWSEVGNWNNAVPGNDTGSTTNTDTAIFNSTPSTNVVNLDVSNWNIGNITFTGSSADDFAIGATAN